MSTGRSNVMDALPHASLLTYFQRPRPRQSHRTSRYYQRPPPPYSADCARPLLPRIPEVDPETLDVEGDEESQVGSWGEGPASKYYDEDSDEEEEDEGEGERESEGCSWGFYISLVCYALLVLLLVLNLDALLSRMGVGTAKYTSTSQKMKFCLDSPNRDAPVTRVWRYMPPLSHEDCTTQIATLTAASVDAWRLHSDDKILFGDDVAGAGKKEVEKDKFIGTGPEKTVGMNEKDFGDDLAKEGSGRWREAKARAGYRKRMREVV
ncbi:hypothetical protein P280DRAFT_238951 [Massarina eburnea CBS 473.64]|uniref:Uncharacterized protein n=1 Tax=Massarina eburnea CBS 473.64 TaxID=1395130 RepID=A0A6A6RKK3_9PLEO|nr:hypothetical protein P280DRAFT_238951 [Massarina eburnea CBS 473.64]